MSYVLGIDVGSGYTKAVLCEGKTLRSYAIVPSGGNYKDTVKNVVDSALERVGIALKDVSRTVATGYGAPMVDFSDQMATDISCHAAGIYHLFPSARTVIDIGAQFSKAIRLNDAGKVTNFLQNEKCAGGSGKFLQVMARILHINLNEIGPLSLTSMAPVQFTTGCAVFAESEAVSRVAEGALPADILAGIHRAMASKIVNLVVRLGLTKDCAVTGGGSKDAGLVKAVGEELETTILVPDEPQISAALGAAILAANELS